MLDLELSIKDQVIYNLKADGLIVSSSTGSTAYSYSGGGPIISPKLDALSLLPMFSHSSSSHSLLLSNKEEVNLKIKNKNTDTVQIFMDGKKNLKYSKSGLKISNTKKLLNFIIQKTMITLKHAEQSWVGLCQLRNLKMISAKSSNLSFLFILSFLFSSSILESQTQEDLSYLDLLPSNQSQSIAERLGIQTGKPINDEVVVDSFDEPRFQSSTSNTSLLKEIPNSNTEIETFGLNIFKDSPTTFAPVDLAPAPLDYVIGPGDELRIQLFGTENINRLIKVNREGNIVIP